jgi:hypothetical protein
VQKQDGLPANIYWWKSAFIFNMPRLFSGKAMKPVHELLCFNNVKPNQKIAGSIPDGVIGIFH